MWVCVFFTSILYCNLGNLEGFPFVSYFFCAVVLYDDLLHPLLRTFSHKVNFARMLSGGTFTLLRILTDLLSVGYLFNLSGYFSVFVVLAYTSFGLVPVRLNIQQAHNVNTSFALSIVILPLFSECDTTEWRLSMHNLICALFCSFAVLLFLSGCCKGNSQG
jgi:hypothetical protein